ncbi:MAG TPA: hypothetical protein VF796_16885 [Humisphaera sp.]
MDDSEAKGRYEAFKAWHAEREGDAYADANFPWREMSPERYVALRGHLVLCFSLDLHRYRDPALGAWMRRLGELLREGDGEFEQYRKRHLTPEEYARVRAEIAAADAEWAEEEDP